MTPSPAPTRTDGHTRWSTLLRQYEAVVHTHPMPGAWEAWLHDWDAAELAVQAEFARLHRARHANLHDTAAHEAYEAFTRDVHSGARALRAHARRTFLHTAPAACLAPEITRRLQNEEALAAASASSDQALAIAALQGRYSRTAASLRVTVGGQTYPVGHAAWFLQHGDRAVREAAWRSASAARLDAASEFDDVFLALVRKRQEVARTAGFADYPTMRFRELGRLDYTPGDCTAFHGAVEAHVAPLMRTLLAERQRELGLGELAPWDLYVDTGARPPLPLWRNSRDLVDRAGAALAHVDAEFGEAFERMRDGHLIDVDARPGKPQGIGFCSFLPHVGDAYVQWSATGSQHDVTVLLHEAGHAFTFQAMLHAQRHDPAVGPALGVVPPLEYAPVPQLEFLEVPSQALELLTLPHLAAHGHGGFFSSEDAERVRQGTLARVIGSLCVIARGDAFQHWVYAQNAEQLTPRALREKWLELGERFIPGVHVSGVENELSVNWQELPHVFLEPFFLFEYGVAWLGALQAWQAARHDHEGTLARLKKAFRVVGQLSVPELYGAAGLDFSWDDATVRAAANLLRAELQAVPA